MLGGLVLSFREARDLTADDRTLVRAIAGQCALALERARLLDNEREASLRAEFLAAAS